MSTPHQRRPSGTPTGGQFAPISRDEVDGVELTDDAAERIRAYSDASDEAIQAAVDNPVAYVVITSNGTADTEAQFDTLEDADQYAAENYGTVIPIVDITSHVANEEQSDARDDPDFDTLFPSGPPPDPSVKPSHMPDGSARHINPDGYAGGWVSPDAQVDPSATIGEGSEVRSNAIVQRGVVIGSNSLVAEHAQVMQGARVGHNCDVLENSRLASGASLGNLSTINTGAILDRGARTGERARIGERVFVGEESELGHHAVVGSDATMGRNVTLGGSSRIERFAHVADDTYIAPGCVIGSHADVGRGCYIANGATVAMGAAVAESTDVGGLARPSRRNPGVS